MLFRVVTKRFSHTPGSVVHSADIEIKPCARRPLTQGLSPPRRLPLVIPIKIAMIEKIESARGIVPRALSFSFLQASPQHKEASAEERDTWAIRMENSKLFVIQESVRGLLREAPTVVI